MKSFILLLTTNGKIDKDLDISLQCFSYLLTTVSSSRNSPLHLADYIGLDTIMSVMQSWCDDYPDEPAFIVPQCIQDKVAAGYYGRKSGKGFYHWDGDKRGDPL